MKKGPGILLAAFFLVILCVVWYRYDQYFLKRNFLIEANVSCDPLAEQCFVADCSPEDPECDATPYKKVEIRAADAPACLVEHTCEAFSCTSDSCSITNCSEDMLEEGEVCTAPEINGEEEPVVDAAVQEGVSESEDPS